MNVVALHTRLRPDAGAEYDRLHRAIPAALLDDLEHAGVADWAIWRSGPDLFHRMVVHDRALMRATMRESSAHLEWQQRLSSLLAPSPASGDLSLVWDLRTQRHG